MAISTYFNESYYLQQNPDVLLAVAKGVFSSGLQHYTLFGGRELRKPNTNFDPTYYLTSNPDVLAAVSKGTFSSALDHFDQFGVKESRVSASVFAGFDSTKYLADNADVAAAITKGTFKSAFDHYLQFGITEARPAFTTSGSTISPTPPTTFTLTSATNTFTGTSGNDAFVADIVAEGGLSVQTLNNTDSLNGGAGTDTLTATISASVTPASLSGIEIISVTNTAAATLGLTNADSATTLKASSGTGGLTVSGVQKALTSIELSNTSQAVTIENSAGVSGSADSVTVTLSSVTGGAFTLGSTAANGYETLTIASGGSVDNTLASISDGATATSLTKLVVTGAKALTITGTLDTTLVTVDASAATGALNVTQTNASTMTITGGAGNDVINLGGSYTSADTVNGGAGTDRLRLTGAEITAATTTQTLVSNLETIDVMTASAGAQTAVLANFGASNFRFSTAFSTNNTSTITGPSTLGLDFQATDITANGNVTVNATGTGTSDVANITWGTSGAAAVLTTNNIIMNGYETVNITSQGAANSIAGTFTMTATASSETINITGSQALTFTGAVTADKIDGSAMTGALVLGAATVAAGGAVISGGSAADTLRGSTNADVISGGGGADTIIGGGGADIITTGAGADTSQFSASSASAANYAGFANITDNTVGTTAAASDKFGISEGNTFGAAGNVGFAQGGGAAGSLAATAAGSVVIQTVAKDAGAAAVTGTAQFIKLTTGVAFNTDVQTTFNNAIGTATITGLTATTSMVGSYYDTTNSRAVIIDILATAGTNTVIETGDAVRVIGTMDMSATDYANFGTNQLVVF